MSPVTILGGTPKATVAPISTAFPTLGHSSRASRAAQSFAEQSDPLSQPLSAAWRLFRGERLWHHQNLGTARHRTLRTESRFVRSVHDHLAIAAQLGLTMMTFPIPILQRLQ